MSEGHPYSQTDWSERFVSELLRLWPGTLNAPVLAEKLWAFKGADGMWPEEAAQRFDAGEFPFFRH